MGKGNGKEVTRLNALLTGIIATNKICLAIQIHEGMACFKTFKQKSTAHNHTATDPLNSTSSSSPG
jgi:hypothetical protein